MGTIWGLGCIVPFNREATSFYLVVSIDVLLLSIGLLVIIGLDFKILISGRCNWMGKIWGGCNPFHVLGKEPCIALWDIQTNYQHQEVSWWDYNYTSTFLQEERGEKVNCMIILCVLGCFIPCLMEVSWVHLIRPSDVLSMPNSFPGDYDVVIQKVDCCEVILYENIWRWVDSITHSMKVTYVLIFRNTDALLT